MKQMYDMLLIINVVYLLLCCKNAATIIYGVMQYRKDGAKDLKICWLLAGAFEAVLA